MFENIVPKEMRKKVETKGKEEAREREIERERQ